LNKPIQPVLLSGGAGSRLWPVSNAGVPKPFLPLVESRSTFDAALARVADKEVFVDPLIVARREHRYLIEAALSEAGVAGTLLLEPEAVGTAAAVAAAAEWAAAKDPETLILVLATDHVIRDGQAFLQSVAAARPAAEAGQIVVFGIAPSGPETGYGYVRPSAPGGAAPSPVAAFVEKPDAARARHLIAEGCLWNSGNFLIQASTAIAETKRHAPAIARAVAAAVRGASQSDGAVELAREPALGVERISFDHAVLEKTDRAAVVAAGFDWADVGTWASVWAASDRDASGNVTTGEVALVDTGGSLVRTDGPLVGVVGMTDTVVVAANNAVLVAPRNRADEVRRLAGAVAEVESKLLGGHARHYRPWGYYQSLDVGEAHQVKRIVVNPGARLSLQKHHHRAEHWTVVAGTVEVTVDESVRMIGENESVFIPLGAVHRAANPGDVPAMIIEVQHGDYLGEDDIVRIQDDYGR
jgi:mannose-1-phosphate guanylyltransferase / mannose-6-phosphate isomerase